MYINSIPISMYSINLPHYKFVKSNHNNTSRKTNLNFINSLWIIELSRYRITIGNPAFDCSPNNHKLFPRCNLNPDARLYSNLPLSTRSLWDRAVRATCWKPRWHPRSAAAVAAAVAMAPPSRKLPAGFRSPAPPPPTPTLMLRRRAPAPIAAAAFRLRLFTSSCAHARKIHSYKRIIY